MKLNNNFIDSCLYCGNPGLEVTKPTNVSVGSAMSKTFSASLTGPSLFGLSGAGTGLSKVTTDEYTRGWDYIRAMLYINCVVCGRRYGVILVRGNKLRPLIRTVISNTDLGTLNTSKIKRFMTKEKLGIDDFYLDAIAITYLDNKTRYKVFLKAGSELHVLFKKYYAIFYKAEKGFRLKNLEYLEKFKPKVT